MFGQKFEYNDELKCCPFCKGVSWLAHVEFKDGSTWFNIQCSKCNAGWMENYETKEEAVKAWNKRK